MAEFIEFAPACKTVDPKPANQNAACGTFWYAEGWINGQRFEFSTQTSRHDAEELCIRLNAVALALSPSGADTEARIVSWLRQDADLTETESRKIVSNSHGLFSRDIADWQNLVATKRGIADAIDRGEYRSTSATDSAEGWS